MELHDRLQSLAERLPSLEGLLETEEATKNALVMPFIQALGYDVFDPRSVTPEFVADVADRRGEKVDYALLHDGSPAVLIECKSAGTVLGTAHLNQLIRYFAATDARIAILTNGKQYRFYTDLDKSHVMDETPFLALDLSSLDERKVSELAQLTKENFDLESMISTARELAYLNGMREALERQLTEPDDEVVTWLAKQVYDGRLVASVRPDFEERTRRAFRSLINEKVNEVLRRAVDIQEQSPHEIEAEDEVESEEGVSEHDSGIVTTAEELEAYEIVKIVLKDTVDDERVTMRDTKSYCGILLDDNNRKPICRFRFSQTKKYISLMDVEKRETRVLLESLDDIYLHADALRATVGWYDSDAG